MSETPPTRLRTNGLLGWWLRLTAPPEVPAEASFAERERTRRGHLVGLLLLPVGVIELGAFYQYLVVDDDHPWMVRVLVCALILTLLAGALNRGGRVSAAGLLLTVVADLPLAGLPATAVGGRLDVLHLGALYLLVGSELVAASVLAPASVFAVAALNSGLLLAAVWIMPHTPALAQLLASADAQQALLGPVVMQVIVAIVAYLWAQSVLSALRRADRAELIAGLQRREVERTRALEEGVHQLLTVHVHLANGDFQSRVPVIRDPLLWQIGSSLNNLIGRLARLAQADFTLHRTELEAQRLVEAVRSAQTGRTGLWPAPSGTPLDPVLVALAGESPRSALASSPVSDDVLRAGTGRFAGDHQQEGSGGAHGEASHWLQELWTNGDPSHPVGSGSE